MKLRVAADVSSPDHVRMFLRRFLRQLIDTMEARGALFEATAKAKERAAQKVSEELKESLDAVALLVSEKDDIARMNGIVRRRREKLIQELCALRNEISEKEKSPLQSKLELVGDFSKGQPVGNLNLNDIVRESKIQLGEHQRLYALERLHYSIWQIASLKHESSRNLEEEYKRKAEKLFRETLGIPKETWEKDFFLAFSETLRQAGLPEDIWSVFRDFHDFHPDYSNSVERSIFLRYANDYLSVLRDEAKRLSPANAQRQLSGEKNERTQDAFPFRNAEWTRTSSNQGAQHQAALEADDLKSFLQRKLEDFVASVERQYFPNGEDYYSIGPDQQMKDHLEKLTTCLFSPYRGNDWLVAFHDLYQKGFLHLDKPGFKEARAVLARRIQEAVEEMRRTDEHTQA